MQVAVSRIPYTGNPSRVILSGSVGATTSLKQEKIGILRDFFLNETAVKSRSAREKDLSDDY